MEEVSLKFPKKLLAPYLFFSCALIISAVIIAAGLSNIAPERGVVSVKGLCEREVPADMAVWQLSYAFGADTLDDLHSLLTSAAADVAFFLESRGLTHEDYTVKPPVITDLSTERYGTEARWRYISENAVLVRSRKVQEVKEAASQSIELMKAGIAATSRGDAVQYLFTGLNDIKPEMIAAAAENAREAAEQFAIDYGSHVGSIKTASQGLFTIEDAAPGLSDIKKVRVVTSIQYYLVD